MYLFLEFSLLLENFTLFIFVVCCIGLHAGLSFVLSQMLERLEILVDVQST